MDRVGEVYFNSYGTEYVIVEYNNYSNVIVEFKDGYKTRVRTRYDHCKNGSVANPYDKTVFGVGFIGLNKDGIKPNTGSYGYANREYSVWHGMLQRCYSERWHDRYPSYKDATVCERWLCFANFLEDLPLIEGYELWRDNPNQRISLDKDIKGDGNKIYSLQTCVFVEQHENVMESVERCGRKTVGKFIGENVKTGEKTQVFNSLCEAQEVMGIHKSGIGLCLRGKRKTASGYKWYRVD